MARISELFDDLGADGKPARLGLMGGTFDPVHDGHLACAEQTREAFGLDAVLFIPAGNPSFKRDKQVTPAQHRLAMCRAAVAENPYFDVSSIEIDRPGITYTIDTLRALREHYPQNVEFYFICGDDAIATVHQWRESAALGQLAKFIGVGRPGFELSEAQRGAIRASAPSIDISFLTIEALHISSSALRARVEAGKSIRYLTPRPVVDYIAQQGLYGKKSD